MLRELCARTALPTKLGVVGRGPFGKKYADTLKKMGIEFWHHGKDHNLRACDGVIIASAAESHFQVAKDFIQAGVPVLIEKPVCMTTFEAKKLLAIGKHMDAIIFSGYTRLYSPAWRAIKAKVDKLALTNVEAQAGGRCKLHHKLEWGSHLTAMCLDLDYDPKKALIVTSDNEMPFRVRVNGEHVFDDRMTDPSPLAVLIG